MLMTCIIKANTKIKIPFTGMSQYSVISEMTRAEDVKTDANRMTAV